MHFVRVGETDCVYASVEDHDALLQVGSAAAQTGVATPEALQQLGVHHLPVHLNGHVELYKHRTVSMADDASAAPMRRARCELIRKQASRIYVNRPHLGCCTVAQQHQIVN